MSPIDNRTPFQSTEEYYADYRPGYGDTAVRYLRGRFALDDSARVLDLGCGTGQLALSLAPHVGEVVGMDPNEEMLRQARRRADASGVENIEWVVGSDAELASELGNELGQFRLATMGRSFHWMDQERTLERLYSMTIPDGGVAVLNDAEWLTRGEKEWQSAVYELADEYLEDLPPRTGPVDDYDDPWDEMLAEFGFTDVEVVVFERTREWTVDSIVGYVFSLSYCSPATFGDDEQAFETDLRARLNELGDERFVQHAEVEVLSGRTPGQ